MSRQEQIIELLAEVGLALDDDDIAFRLGINRHYVNAVCRSLGHEGVISRFDGPAGKLVNQIADTTRLADPEAQASHVRAIESRPRSRRADRARRNVDALVANLSDCVATFEHTAAFPGPSLYFHERALHRRRLHSNAASLLADKQFLEYVYAVLPAWGMHRMGNQRAKVVEFDEMVESFRALEPQIQALWEERITDIEDAKAEEIGGQVWQIIATLSVSRSKTHIVAGSKALHHVLPNLVPPIDRQYTFQFFTGQKNVQHGEAMAFAEWFPFLCEVGLRCSQEIEQILQQGGFMATGPAKVIDNAIIGYLQSDRSDQPGYAHNPTDSQGTT